MRCVIIYMQVDKGRQTDGEIETERQADSDRERQTQTDRQRQRDRRRMLNVSKSFLHVGCTLRNQGQYSHHDSEVRRNGEGFAPGEGRVRPLCCCL